MASSEDKYETLEKIGHGSFGVIRKVRCKADGFIMCRKEISYLRMSQKEREQLHAEFQILSHLRHPNIVAYYHREHLKLSQDLHLYMEYCGNGDLGRVIKDLQHTGRRAQESFVWSIFSQLVMALYRCHYGVDPPEVGAHVLGLTPGVGGGGGGGGGSPPGPAGAVTILHRDLKPENVFLGEDNSVKLGDFGLSKMIQSHDFASTYVGTPFYMSPEICAAEKYTLKSDIWSLGCIMYELCAREPPFNAKSHFQLVQRIKEARVPALPDFYSPELNQVVRDCLQANPDRRPDTAQLLALPVVRLMRKEKEVVDLNRALRARDEALRLRERELGDRLAKADEAEAALRREWDVRARLEIDRQVGAETAALQRRFDDEVRARVDAELQRRRTGGGPDAPRATPTDSHGGGETAAAAAASAPIPTPAPAPDATNSPDGAARRSARTPFGRAQTMFAGTPMDVEMASPSPVAIASLSLSPRRTGSARPPAMHAANLFADARWELRREQPGPRDSNSDSDDDGDDDDDEAVPSPTRHIRSSKNPFTARDRPVLASQNSCPPAAGAASLLHRPGGSVLRALAPQRSPAARPASSRIPALPEAAPAAGGLVGRKPSVRREGEPLGRTAAKNTIRGRTLVELQQARAGGRAAPGVAAAVAVWDPDRDEMPSPFLVRPRRLAREV